MKIVVYNPVKVLLLCGRPSGNYKRNGYKSDFHEDGYYKIGLR